MIMTNIAAGTQPLLRIFRPNGTEGERFLACADPPGVESVRTIADQVPVTQIMSREVTCARRDLSASALADLMVNNHIGCIPVVEDLGRPVGMITKRDLVETLTDANARERTANELMMPLAITLGPGATVAHAAALMAAEDIHHTLIVDQAGQLIGVVSTMDIVRWLARNDGFGVR